MDANWRTAQRWQKGKLPRLPTLLRLADVLGVPHADLIAAEEPPVTLQELHARVAELTARVEALARAVSSLEQERWAPATESAASATGLHSARSASQRS